jgi:nicotinamide phosphoribosyltransferase
MIEMNPMLLCDTYKTVHNMMYPQGLEKLVSYWVPRKSYFEKEENQKMVWFGLQAFLKEYLVDYFEKNFFNKSEEEIVESYRKVMDVQLDGFYDINPIIQLHRLGYLPLEIRALPEGSKVNMGIPCIELTNTHTNFAWLVQWVECLLQVELWKICNDATIGNMYYRLAKYWYDKNSDDNLDPRNAFSNFDMRGDDCLEVAPRTAAAWLLSSNKTSTIPALPFLDKYYAAHT